MTDESENTSPPTLKEQLYTIIFGHQTPKGKLFDLVLIFAILLSVVIVILDSINFLSERYGLIFFIFEWAFTIFFTIEYGVRIYCSPNRFRYIFSFYGIIDFLSIIPTYLGLFVTGFNYLLIVRLLRVLRIFRILKLIRLINEANILTSSVLKSWRKIFIFFTVVIVLSTVFGSIMFLVEGPGNGFTSIPKSIYWTIVTITTVGYGDITPQTELGQFISALVMLMGYSIIAVPTGIFTAEIAHEMQRQRRTRYCNNCERGGHESDADYCRFCGTELPELKETLR